MRRIIITLALASTALAGCASALDAHNAGFYASNGGPVGPAPSPSPAGTTTPTSCSPGTATQTAATIVLMSALIGSSSSAYGTIAGFVNNTSPTAASAAPVTMSASSTVQFFNGDPAGQTRSAIGLPGATFPTSYSFPSSAASGSTIAAAGNWSTGLIPSQCFSQSFTIAGPGTYLFGDFSAYLSSGLRGVLIAQ